MAANDRSQEREEEIDSLFNSISGRDKEYLLLREIIKKLEAGGISKDEARIKKCLDPHVGKDDEDRITKEEFRQLFEDPEAEVIKKALKDELVIPNFADFKKDIEKIYEVTRNNTEGEMNDTVPHPAPDRQPAYAVSICTVDGQLLQLGDHDLAFLLQSICKPVNYAIVHKETGKEKLHQHVGVEPGDESFESSQILNEEDLPHNPMITSGAIMTSSFIKPEQEMDERLDHVMDVWKKMTGGKDVGYNEESFRAERKDANKHLALAHLMKERGAFPGDVDLHPLVDFYLKCCAIEVNIDDLAHAAAAMANYGKCPSTGTKIFEHDTVRDTLSLMLSSGMYDHSGEFAFRVGLPAKSGIAGGIMVVIPELMGIAVYSPPLDSHGNSVRGMGFLEKLVDTFNFHKYDALDIRVHGKKDPRNK